MANITRLDEKARFLDPGDLASASIRSLRELSTHSLNGDVVVPQVFDMLAPRGGRQTIFGDIADAAHATGTEPREVLGRVVEMAAARGLNVGRVLSLVDDRKLRGQLVRRAKAVQREQRLVAIRDMAFSSIQATA